MDMDKYSDFLARQGEPALIAIVENWERYAGLKTETTISLEGRWSRMMQPQSLIGSIQ